MATIRCPKGCRWISQRGNLIFENQDVVVFAEVCDHSDRCGMEDCEYFDNSREATRRFLRAQALGHGTPEQQKEAAQYERMLCRKHGQKPPRSRFFP